MIVSVPPGSAPAAIEKLTDPFVRFCGAAEKDPLFRLTVPVGVPFAPDTVTAIVVPCAVVMLDGFAVTVTVAGFVPLPVVGQAFTTFATFSEPRPDARSKPAVALNTFSTPTVSPLTFTRQFDMFCEFCVHGIAFVPLSMSLNTQLLDVEPLSLLQFA